MDVTSRQRRAPATRSISPVRPTKSYREQYGVIVLCDDEKDQERVYNRLRRDGLQCRVVTT